jgi:hypothetical protein
MMLIMKVRIGEIPDSCGDHLRRFQCPLRDGLKSMSFIVKAVVYVSVFVHRAALNLMKIT